MGCAEGYQPADSRVHICMATSKTSHTTNGERVYLPDRMSYRGSRLPRPPSKYALSPVKALASHPPAEWPTMSTWTKINSSTKTIGFTTMTGIQGVGGSITNRLQIWAEVAPLSFHCPPSQIAQF